MARLKKRADGLLQQGFRFEGKLYMVYGHSAAELSQKREAKIAELKAGTANRKNPIMENYYEDFSDRRHGKVSGNTIRIQRSHFNRVKDIPVDDNGLTFGRLRIADITPSMMLIVQKSLSEKYSASTVNDSLHHISLVFSTAIKEEIIDKNPCRILEQVKKTERPASETIHRALTHEEARKFFNAAGENFYQNAFMFMMQTGLRIGELSVLNDLSIDEKNMMLHVRNTQTRGEYGTYEIGTTAKTKKGIRDIPLTAEALETIRKQRELKRIVFGNTVIPFLFPSSRGNLLEETVMNNNIAIICKTAGIDKFTCHALRATFATRFIEQRPEDYKALSEILGHADISISLNLYTHVMQERKIEAMRNVHIAI